MSLFMLKVALLSTTKTDKNVTAVYLGGAGQHSNQVESFGCKVDFPDLPESRRDRPAAVYYDIDKFLMICGGLNEGGFLSSCHKLEEYKNWEPAESMNTARARFTINKVGAALVAIGGTNGVPLRSTEIMIPGLSSWMPSWNSTIERDAHCTVTISHEEVLIIGGYNGDFLDLVERHNVVTGRSTLLRHLRVGRFGHSCVHHAATGNVVVAGGWSQAGVSDKLEMLSLRSGAEWKFLSQLPAKIYLADMAFINDRLEIYGSYTDSTKEYFIMESADEIIKEFSESESSSLTKDNSEDDSAVFPLPPFGVKPADDTFPPFFAKRADGSLQRRDILWHTYSLYWARYDGAMAVVPCDFSY